MTWDTRRHPSRPTRPLHACLYQGPHPIRPHCPHPHQTRNTPRGWPITLPLHPLHRTAAQVAQCQGPEDTTQAHLKPAPTAPKLATLPTQMTSPYIQGSHSAMITRAGQGQAHPAPGPGLTISQPKTLATAALYHRAPTDPFDQQLTTRLLANIRMQGQPIQAHPPTHPYKLLGVWFTMDLNWKKAAGDHTEPQRPRHSPGP
jgi:hypothetical protein